MSFCFIEDQQSRIPFVGHREDVSGDGLQDPRKASQTHRGENASIVSKDSSKNKPRPKPEVLFWTFAYAGKRCYKIAPLID